MALLSDLTREQNRTKAMAFIGISVGITFAIAMVTGPVITYCYDLQTLFSLMALLAGVAICATLWLVPGASSPFRHRESGMIKDDLWDVLSNLHLLKLNMGILCLHILLMAGFIALPGLFEQAGMNAEQHWKVYLTTMLVSFICIMPVILYAEGKRRIRRLFICCVALLLISEIVQWGAGDHLYPLIVGVQLFFLAFNLMEALLPSLISKGSPAGYKGTAMGIYSTCQFIGVAIGGCGGGWLLQHVDAQSVFFFCVLIAAWWLISSTTMHDPPCVSSLRIELTPAALCIPDLARRLQTHPGVSSVLVVPQEQSAYIKIDNKITSRTELEQLISTQVTTARPAT